MSNIQTTSIEATLSKGDPVAEVVKEINIETKESLVVLENIVEVISNYNEIYYFDKEGFIFKSSPNGENRERLNIIPFEIKDVEGNILASYPLDVAHLEQTKKWIKEILKIQSIDTKGLENEKVMDELAEIEKKVIVSVFGAEAWVELWALFNTNVYIMLNLVQKLSGVLNEQQAKYYKGYV